MKATARQQKRTAEKQNGEPVLWGSPFLNQLLFAVTWNRYMLALADVPFEFTFGTLR
jgi:hypothetical protein